MTPLTILHAEDNSLVAGAVRDALEHEGWRVTLCADGDAAMREIEGAGRYDLLLLDTELPGVGGFELIRRARALPHRRETPIIMLSATDCGAEAYRAGVSVFLRKPEGVGELVSTVARLLHQGAWG